MVHDQQNPNQGTVLTIYPEEGTVLTITPEKGEQHMPYYINDNLTSQESSEEFFSQPAKSLTSKQVSMLGGLHLFREKQKKALKSKPFEDSVAHTSYRGKVHLRNLFRFSCDHLRNEFDFWKVHGIMNTSGLLQSK